MPRFTASRGGHAPGHLREALLDALNDGQESEWFELLNEDRIYFYDPRQRQRWDRMSPIERAHWLCGQLWNCTDILPRMTAQDFPELKSWTYSALVRYLKPQIPTGLNA